LGLGILGFGFPIMDIGPLSSDSQIAPAQRGHTKAVSSPMAGEKPRFVENVVRTATELRAAVSLRRRLAWPDPTLRASLIPQLFLNDAARISL
jgi:hypothetical protein